MRSEGSNTCTTIAVDKEGRVPAKRGGNATRFVKLKAGPSAQSPRSPELEAFLYRRWEQEEQFQVMSQRFLIPQVLSFHPYEDLSILWAS